MKRFVEDDFENRFGFRIDIKNKEYILKRYSTNICIIDTLNTIGAKLATHFPGCTLITNTVPDRMYELCIICSGDAPVQCRHKVQFTDLNAFLEFIEKT